MPYVSCCMKQYVSGLQECLLDSLEIAIALTFGMQFTDKNVRRCLHV